MERRVGWFTRSIVGVTFVLGGLFGAPGCQGGDSSPTGTGSANDTATPGEESDGSDTGAGDDTTGGSSATGTAGSTGTESGTAQCTTGEIDPQGCGTVTDEPEDPPDPMAGTTGTLPTLPGRHGPTDGGVYRLPDRYNDSREWPMMVGIVGYGFDGAATLDAWTADPFVREWVIVVGLSTGDGVHAQNEYYQMQAAAEYMEETFSVDSSNVWAFGTEAGQFAATYAGLQYHNLESTPEPTYQYRGIVTYGGHDGGDFTTYPGMIDKMTEQADKLAWLWIISENDPADWSITVTDRWLPNMQQLDWKDLELSIMAVPMLVYRLFTVDEVQEAMRFFCEIAEADAQAC